MSKSTINEPLPTIRESAAMSGLNLSEEQLVYVEEIVRRRLARKERQHAKRISELTHEPNAALAKKQETTKERELDAHWSAYKN